MGQRRYMDVRAVVLPAGGSYLVGVASCLSVMVQATGNVRLGGDRVSSISPEGRFIIS